GNDAKAGTSRSKCSRQFETMEKVLLPQVHYEFLLWGGCNNEARSRYNTKLENLLPKHIYSPCVVNWYVLNEMGCDEEIDDMLRIKLRKAESNEEIFTSVAWIRAFNIKELIYAKLCYEFYSNYEFDEVCADDELQTKKIIKFRLGGRSHNLTLLVFTHRLGLYHADELEEDIAMKARVLTDVVLKSLSALIYCRDLDTTTLRELIDSKGRLILEDPQLGMPRVGIPRPPRASMQDFHSMISIISSTHLHHHSISNSRRMMTSSVKMTQPLAISLDEVHIDDKLRFVEESVEVMDREVKQLKQMPHLEPYEQGSVNGGRL
nr:hypothetical protein [Tanacetum cinerariifolium]